MDLPEDDQPEDEPRQDRVHFLKVDGETSAHGVRLFLSVLLLQKILAEIFCDGNIISELLDKSIIRAHNRLYKRITERRWGRMRFLNEILLSVMEISISTGVVILILLLSAPFLRKLCGYARLRARVVRRGIFVEGGLISEKLPILRKELTLMSSLDRQYKKTGLLTTQFCGGVTGL